MSIEFLTYPEIIERVRGDLTRLLPDVDPTISGSFAKAFAEALAGRSYDQVLMLQQMLLQMFPQTASGEYLDMFAGWEGLTRQEATFASGNILVTGSVGITIQDMTRLTSVDGRQYYVDGAYVTSANSVPISSLTRSGSTVTATTPSDHGLGTGATITISGADQTDYNGDQEITVTSATQFTYQVSSTPVSPATGTILAGYTGAIVAVGSVAAGADQNIFNGSTLSLDTPQVGLDNTAYVQYPSVSGAADYESDEDLRVRVLQSRSNPVANFNVGAIERAARSVNGVTRVKVLRITPEVGDVTIRFIRDNDDDIIPDSTEVEDVFDAIYEISPANISASQIYVEAPSAVPTNYIFTSLSPDTPTMRSAIEANLAAMYVDEVDFDTDLSEDKYRSAIIDTIDTETGDTLDSFVLSSPSGDISISDGEIATLGTITFP